MKAKYMLAFLALAECTNHHFPVSKLIIATILPSLLIITKTTQTKPGLHAYKKVRSTQSHLLQTKSFVFVERM